MEKEIDVKPKILFVFNHRYPDLWRDGLWAALNLLEEHFEIDRFNMATATQNPVWDHDFLLGWGAFRSRVDEFLLKSKEYKDDIKMGLCLGGYAPAFEDTDLGYDTIFYETKWSKDWLEQAVDRDNLKKIKLMHAFGVNTDIYNPWPEAPIIWDWLSVGSFSYWKRHRKIMEKEGTRLVIGEIQRHNWQESFDIISDLLLAGVGISDMLYPTKLRNIYTCSDKVYIPAEVGGGGERAVLEARACGRPVEVEDDNPKLKGLLNSPTWDHHYYAEQLKKGVESIL